MDITDLDEIENRLILKYKTDVERMVSKLSDKQFMSVLLQRRWTSYAFTTLYDFGIDSVTNEKTKQVLREIRNDEYPSKGPSHREDLVTDLRTIGIGFDEIINTGPSVHTIQRQLEFLKITENPELHDIKVLAFLRFCLEVLVSSEYEVFVKRLEKSGLNKKNSKFYWPHYLHDMKQSSLGSSGKTHSDEESMVLVGMLDNKKKTDFCAKVTEKSYELRMDFFKQFK